MSGTRNPLGLFHSSSKALSRLSFIRGDFFFTHDPSLLRSIQEYATGCLIAPAKCEQPGEHIFNVVKRYTSVGELIQRQLRVNREGGTCVYDKNGNRTAETLDTYLVNANIRDFINAIINDSPYSLFNKFIPGLREPLTLDHLNIAEPDMIVLQLPQHLQSASGTYNYLTVDRRGEVWYLSYSLSRGMTSSRTPDEHHLPIVRKLHEEIIRPLSAQYHTNDICTDTSRLAIHRFQ